MDNRCRALCGSLNYAGPTIQQVTAPSTPGPYPPMITPSETQAPAPKEMNKKPVIYREAKTILNDDNDGFHEKLLCDGITFNAGDACCYSCEFCYVEAQMLKVDHELIDAHNAANGRTEEANNLLRFKDLVIRRENALEILRRQLLKKDGTPQYPDEEDTRVVYGSTLVDVAANMTLVRETAEICNLILEHTHWKIRLLSKSDFLSKLIEDSLIPEQYHQRLILGFSTGTLDDDLANAIETGTARVSKRIKALHWLQDRGIPTFGMICPSLPQHDYVKFSREICDAIRVNKCEHVWAEVINVRGESFARTIAGLKLKKFNKEAEMLAAVINDPEKREEYARATFEAHTKYVPKGKLSFLQYISPHSADWWAKQRDNGAVLLGETAVLMNLTTVASKLASAAPLAADDLRYRKVREKIVNNGVKASLAAARALHEILTYKNGALWKSHYQTFAGYCYKRWGHAKAHSYRLAEAGGFLLELKGQSPIGDWPKNECQIRPLMGLPKDERVEFWKQVVNDVGIKNVTGSVVESRVRSSIKSKPAEIDAETVPAAAGIVPPAVVRNAQDQAGMKERARAALAALKEAVAGLPKAGVIGTLLTRIEKHVG